MRAAVDPDRCQGHLRCALYADTVFAVTDMGHSEVRLDPVPVELEQSTRQAARNCPESAISVTEE
jgi:ferredoxin